MRSGEVDEILAEAEALRPEERQAFIARELEDATTPDPSNFERDFVDASGTPVHVNITPDPRSVRSVREVRKQRRQPKEEA